MYPCIQCNLEVRARQHAVSCDECQRWQHRKCGTGISYQDYMDARKGRAELSFKCNPCSEGNDAASFATTLLEEERNGTHDVQSREEAHEQMDTESQDERNINALVDLMETENTVSTVTTNDSDSSRQTSGLEVSFDMPHRNVTDRPETLEDSIDEPDLPDTIPDDQPVTYTELPNGSQRGGRLLVSSDGYSYAVKKTLSNNRIRWRCSVRNKKQVCTVTVSQDGDRYLTNNHHHTHPPDPCLKAKRVIAVKTKELAKQNMFRPATDIAETAIHDTIGDDDDFTSNHKPKTTLVKRNINRFRAKTRPQQPTELSFEINKDFLNLDEFLIADVNLNTCRHIVFSTPFQINLLRQTKRWFIDGTFKIVGQPFTPNGQLMSINGFVQKEGKKKQFPLVYALMSRRRKTDYIAVLEAVKEKLTDPVVESFVLDFESGAWQAIREVFPNAEIKGCVFHWTQAVYRKATNLGLSTAYREKGAIYNYIRLLLALPFLPSGHIVDTFRVLKEKANTIQLEELVDYIDNQWMDNPVFPVADWSIYNHSVRTNNDVEGWHRRLNAHGAGLSFYKLVPVLQKESKIVELNVRAEDLETNHRTRYTKISQKLDEAWTKYSAGDPDDQQLRKVEKEIMIPQKMKERAKVERCAEEIKGYGICAKESGVLLPFYCRQQAKVLKTCLENAYNDQAFVDDCTREYLEERSIYRRTGIRKKQQKKESATF